MKPLFIFWGKVISGARRGRLLGYSTANIPLHKKIPEGIYAATVSFRSVIPAKAGIYSAATFIGSAKTFGETDYKAESFLLDFNQDLYGKYITIRLYKKIRENQKFTSEKELIEQMKEDVEEVRSFFNKKY